MPFLQLALAVALGVGIPLFIFKLWLSSRLDWYLGVVVPNGLDKIEQEVTGTSRSDIFLPIRLPLLATSRPRIFLAARTAFNCCRTLSACFCNFASACRNAAKMFMNPPGRYPLTFRGILLSCQPELSYRLTTDREGSQHLQTEFVEG